MRNIINIISYTGLILYLTAATNYSKSSLSSYREYSKKNGTQDDVHGADGDEMAMRWRFPLLSVNLVELCLPGT